MTRLAIVGTGAWGTALAIHGANKGLDVALLGRRPDVVERLRATRAHPALPGALPIPPQVTITTDAREAFSGVAAVLWSVSVQATAPELERLAPLLPSVPLVATSKGLEIGSRRRTTEIMAFVTGRSGGLAALSGPTFAAEVARGLLPLPYRGVIDGEAAEQCLDPMLLAAVIRQESRFTAKAVSRAGARGIAQVFPPTGRVLARRLRIRGWDPALLFVPDFNLHLGALLVRQRIRGEVLPEYAAIAAYNIGAPRVDRWRGWPEFRDPDLFVERIAISETRNYVKAVYASYQWYRRLYAAPGGPDSPVPSAPPPS